MTQERPTLIFLHIHKTAGTSLKHLLTRLYPRDTTLLMDQRYFRLQDALDELAGLEPAGLERIDCLIGHVAYGVHRLLPRPPAYITMLREPVARTLSHYQFLRTVPAPFITRILDEKTQLTPYERRFRDHLRPDDTPANSLAAFLDMSRESESLNLQTRMIGGFVPSDRFVPPYPPLPPNALEVAKANLRNHIAAFGLVERFDESLMLMKSQLGWRTIHYLRENVTRGPARRSAADRSLLQAIERDCGLDLELYEFARHLLEERLREAREITSAALQDYRRGNRAYQRLHALYDRSGLRRLRSLIGSTLRS
jgi:hypothetical protein